MSGATTTKARQVATMTFGGGSPQNYISLDTLTAIADALDDIDADPAMRVSILRSDGRVFCAGADHTASAVPDAERNQYTEDFYTQVLRIFAARKPIVAAVQGAAVGAGLGLALVADFRVAAPEARFTANFVNLGYYPGFGLTYTLPRLIGEQRAALMLLTGRRIRGEQAAAWGLADELAPLDQLTDTAMALAEEIGNNAPLSVEATRATLRADLSAEIKAVIEAERVLQAETKATNDYKEGVKAVWERRLGQFTRS